MKISKKDLQRIRDYPYQWTQKELAEFVFTKGKLPQYNDKPINKNQTMER